MGEYNPGTAEREDNGTGDIPKRIILETLVSTADNFGNKGIPAAIFEKYRISYVNEPLSKIVGHSSEECEGKNVLYFMADEKDMGTLGLAKSLGENGEQIRDVSVKTKDGRTIRLSMDKWVYNHNGIYVYSMAAFAPPGVMELIEMVRKPENEPVVNHFLEFLKKHIKIDGDLKKLKKILGSHYDLSIVQTVLKSLNVKKRGY